MWSETVGLRTNRSETKKSVLVLVLHAAILVLLLWSWMVLILRIWSCLHHWLRKDRRRKRELKLAQALLVEIAAS